MYSWSHSDYLVLSGSVSTNYKRNCSQQSKGDWNLGPPDCESDSLTTQPRCLSGDVMKRSNYNDKGKKNKTYCLTVWTSLMLSSVNTKTNKISDMKPEIKEKKGERFVEVNSPIEWVLNLIEKPTSGPPLSVFKIPLIELGVLGVLVPLYNRSTKRKESKDKSSFVTPVHSSDIMERKPLIFVTTLFYKA